MYGVYAKKGLGQHFLTDKNIARKIVASLQLDNINTLIEIGPGTGILTRYLLQLENTNFIAVELDKESIDFLNRTFPGNEAKFVFADILRFSLNGFQTPIAFIGNFPYYISSQILFKVLENRNTINHVVCMLQKEVAERIASPPGSKKYGILSVLLQAYYEIEYLFTVSEHCFIPPPKVKSAVIRLIRNDKQELNCDPDVFFKVVKASFNQRRKVIRNSLHSVFAYLPTESELLAKRPEQLSVGQFEKLALLVDHLNR
jgi:16S rRNA (adenine1518-N6/adenine1519-N6)-dimethyltransferase